MASYIESTLTDGEKVLHTGHISLWSMWALILFGLITLPIGVGLIILGVAFVRYKSTEIAITNKRTVAKFGFISRRTIEINLPKVESIQVLQSIPSQLTEINQIYSATTGYNTSH